MKRKLLVFVALLVLVLACASVALAEDVDEGAFIDWGSRDKIAKVGGHDVTQPIIIDKEPTCEDYGQGHFVCQVGETTHTHWVFFFPLGHDWSSKSETEWGNVKEAPTCSKEGYAVDYCLRCKVEDPNHIRNIDKKPHEYDDDHYVVYKQPGCAEEGTGLGQHCCIYCGQLKDETEEEMVKIPKIPHNWSDWRKDRASTCKVYGAAARTCLRCGATQFLDEGHSVFDQGHEITIDMVLRLLNPDWNTSLEGQVYDEQNKLEKALLAQGFEYELKESWLKDCYTRQLTYTCPHCKGTEHTDFTVTLTKPATIAHVWNEEPEPDDDPTTEPKEGESVAPTCLTDGYYVYLCEYDGDVHEHVKGTFAERQADDAQKVVKREALDHDWGKWIPTETFTKDGVTYVVSFRGCSRCRAHEQKTEKAEDPEKKNGLVKDEDGVWRFYVDDKVATNFTNLIPFQGGEFWVVNGEVPADANGLTICPDGKAYFLAYGQVQRGSSGFAEYNGEWFMIKNGELDVSANGLYDYNGGTFLFAAGKLINTYNGLWLNPKDGKWYFLANGQVQYVSDVVGYDGEFFVVDGGILNTGYNGLIEYDGKDFNVVNGQLYEIVD